MTRGRRHGPFGWGRRGLLRDPVDHVEGGVDDDAENHMPDESSGVGRTDSSFSAL